MRQSGIPRFSNLSLSRSARDYIVMHFLIEDLGWLIGEYAKGDVLDIGCGNKPYESFFSSSCNSYTGCDVVQSDKNKVDVICEATDLRFADGQFDMVFSTQVMEHVADPVKMLREAARVLKAGGHIVFSIPFCWELHEEPYDFYRYSKYGLRAMFEREGFEVKEIKANGGKWAAIFQMNLNIIYSTFRRKKIFSRILKILFVNLRLTSLVNRLALWMDKKYFDELLTLNYVIAGVKKS